MFVKDNSLETCATLFTGINGSGVGMRNAGLKSLWGVDHDARAVAIARLNGFEVEEADVGKVAWAALEIPDVLAISPPCQRASKNNPHQTESALDEAAAVAASQAIAKICPEFVILENVEAYQNFDAFKLIDAWLSFLGYSIQHKVLDFSDYGLPQSRKRFILLARLKAEPKFPEKKLDKVGWGSVIERSDMENHWCSKVMRSKLKDAPLGVSMATGLGRDRKPTYRSWFEPAPTITAAMDRPSQMPVLINRQGGEAPTLYRTLTTEGLGKLQGFPDDYCYGALKGAARKGIGNAFPPSIMEQIIRANN